MFRFFNFFSFRFFRPTDGKRKKKAHFFFKHFFFFNTSGELRPDLRRPLRHGPLRRVRRRPRRRGLLVPPGTPRVARRDEGPVDVDHLGRRRGRAALLRRARLLAAERAAVGLRVVRAERHVGGGQQRDVPADGAVPAQGRVLWQGEAFFF